jgi:putative ABC transport system permease protein
MIDRLPFWGKLSFDTQWNLRDVFRCIGRSFMAIVGVLGCSALLICAFGMQDTFDYVIEWNYGVLNRYETRFELEKTATEEQINNLLKEYDGESILETVVELKANSIKRSGELLVTDQTPLIQFVDKDSNRINLPDDQLSISYKIAEQLKVKVGDMVSWHVYGEEKWNESTIGAIYRTPFTQGITLPKGYYEDYGYTYSATAVVSGVKPDQNVAELEIDGVSKIQTKQNLLESFNSMAEAMDLLIYILLIAAATLAIVVIYNLGVLAFTERQRELSTLKVIGFRTKKLRNLLLAQNIWLTFAGIIPGIPIGIWIQSYIFRFVGEVFDFILKINFSSYLYCILGTLLISIFVNLFFSERVKDIDMVSSLKGVE